MTIHHIIFTAGLLGLYLYASQWSAGVHAARVLIRAF